MSVIYVRCFSILNIVCRLLLTFFFFLILKSISVDYLKGAQNQLLQLKKKKLVSAELILERLDAPNNLPSVQSLAEDLSPQMSVVVGGLARGFKLGRNLN